MIGYRRIKKQDFVKRGNFLLAYLLDALLIFVALFLPKKKDTAPKKILIVRTDYIGDVISTIPAIVLIRKKFPDAKICFLGNKTAGEILRKSPYIDEILTMGFPWRKRKESGFIRFMGDVRRLRRMKFDLVIVSRADVMDIVFGRIVSRGRVVGYGAKGGGVFLTDNVRYDRNQNAYEINLGIARYLGCEGDKPKPVIIPSGPALERVKDIFRERGFGWEDIIVVISPVGGNPVRNWMPERFAIICDYVHENLSKNIIIAGDKGGIAFSREIVSKTNVKLLDLTGVTSIAEFIALISISDLVISVDTSVRHISACFNVPTIVLQYAGEFQRHWEPYVKTEFVIRKNPDCSPCYKLTCDNRICMKEITAEEIVSMIEKIKDNVIERNKRKRTRLEENKI